MYIKYIYNPFNIRYIYVRVIYNVLCEKFNLFTINLLYVYYNIQIYIYVYALYLVYNKQKRLFTD